MINPAPWQSELSVVSGVPGLFSVCREMLGGSETSCWGLSLSLYIYIYPWNKDSLLKVG